jgi:peptidoglycan/xylan/chitin deacetylase (PgdA/CDA1 family)
MPSRQRRITSEWARLAAYRLLFHLGSRRRGIRVVLTYHSIGADAALSLPTAAFRSQVAFLRQNFRIVPLRDLSDALASLPADTNIACMTFDDGYADGYETVLPILAEAGIKATFFIATGFLGGMFPTSSGSLPMMTAGQVAELAASGHEIGAHTVNHPKLASVPLPHARAEVEGSKHRLEDLTGADVSSFAYPKGDFDEGVKAMVGSLGFQRAATTRLGLVGPGVDWLAVPRPPLAWALTRDVVPTTVYRFARRRVGSA